MGAIFILVALISIPIIVASSGQPVGPQAYPVLDVIPEKASGAYLDVSAPAGDGYVALFVWTTPPDSIPPETPVLAPGTVTRIVLAQKGLDQPDRYRLYEFQNRALVAVDAASSETGRQMLLRPVAPLADGTYLLDVPIGGMFAGRQYYLFSVGPDASPLVSGDEAEVAGFQPLGNFLQVLSWILAGLAGITATLFCLDLTRRYRTSRKRHTAAYAAGMGMFAIATWCLFAALSFSWSGQLFRAFYLFGGVLNVPVLAIGSIYLVVGPRAGRVSVLAVAIFGAISALVTLTASFTGPIPASGIPSGSELFDFPGPRLCAALGGGLGSLVIVSLAVVSLFRFRKSNPFLVRANLMIVGGILAAAWGGTGLALGEESGFAVSLLVAAALIWGGHHVAGLARRDPTPGVDAPVRETSPPSGGESS